MGKGDTRQMFICLDANDNRVLRDPPKKERRCAKGTKSF